MNIACHYNYRILTLLHFTLFSYFFLILLFIIFIWRILKKTPPWLIETSRFRASEHRQRGARCCCDIARVSRCVLVVFSRVGRGCRATWQKIARVSSWFVGCSNGRELNWFSWMNIEKWRYIILLGRFLFLSFPHFSKSIWSLKVA